MATWVQQASDDFERANEDPLNTNWAVWASAAGNRWQVNSSVAMVVGGDLGTDMATGWGARTWAQDHASRCEVTVTGTGADTGPGPCVRLVEGAHTSGYYLYRLVVNKGASNNVQIDRASNGSWTAPVHANAVWTVAHVDGDTYELRVEGLGASTVLTVLRNGSEVGNYSDTSGLSAAGIPGIAYSSTCTVAYIDNWVGLEAVPEAGRAYKRLYGPAQLTGSAADLYTCPASTTARTLHIHASNPSGSPVDVNLSIGADAAATRVWDDLAISADGVKDVFDPYELAAGEKIQGWADTAGTVVVTITGYEDPV